MIIIRYYGPRSEFPKAQFVDHDAQKTFGRWRAVGRVKGEQTVTRLARFFSTYHFVTFSSYHGYGDTSKQVKALSEDLLQVVRGLQHLRVTAISNS